MFNVVFAQDDDGPLGAQAALQQRLADAPGAIERFGVADAAPLAFRAVGILDALGEKGALGRGLRPMHQLIRQALGAGLQRLLGFQIAHAVWPFAHDGAGHAEMKRAVLRGVAGGGGVLAHLSRSILS